MSNNFPELIKNKGIKSIRPSIKLVVRMVDNDNHLLVSLPITIVSPSKVSEYDSLEAKL